MALILFLGLAACTNNDDVTISKNSVTNTVMNGTWRITSFIDSGNDETNHFNGYNFTFGGSNVLMATNGANTFTGTWSVTNSSSGKVEFNIAFAAPPDFEELTEDWDVISMTSTKIDLKHVSGGGGGTDYLTLQKN